MSILANEDNFGQQKRSECQSLMGILEIFSLGQQKGSYIRFDQWTGPV
jgi:hypothetical protein